ncbi:MAG: exodeoxyribonuclease VII small subunit [Alloprevotella sp.]|nr:exodeoxyribonuclease VII small subunit [Alloprevotella sp.]MBR1446296.1 exodeoxyribonuclease VII small subunit [Alloprevotella sp.]MBR6340005.1 exodeoxyribonuclease VII small subunit [Alloprevotella sp.]
MEKKISYEQAMARVEQIVQALESGETKLENLSDLLREAKELITLCRKQLMKTEDDINKIIEDGKR